MLVRAGNAEAKLWLEPQVRVAYSTGFDAATLRELTEVAQLNSELIEGAWNEYFGKGGSFRRSQPVGASRRRASHCGATGLVSTPVACAA